MFKKLARAFLWFWATPILLAASIFFILQHGSNSKSDVSSEIISIPANTQLNVSNHLEGQVLAVEIADIRPYLVENFLNNTPLEPYSKLLVEISDKYGLDYRLIPAIAMKETGGGTAARKESYNAWGFENGRTNFNSWEGAIVAVAKTLKENYIDRGLVTPEQIMAVYAPPQLLTGGKWAEDINFFFQKLESL